MYTYNHSLANINSLLSEASRHNIEHTLDPTIRDSKANTNWSPAPPDHTPSVVFFPHTTHETSVILKACNDRCIAVTPFSGGTSFGGALAATKGGVCISFERMKSIIAVHEDDLDVVVQPGLGWVELNDSLKERGLFFPVDPAPGAKIGGMLEGLLTEEKIAMSCSGTNAYHYGTMKENVISLTCVLPSGNIVKTHNRPRKSSAGYDLTHLLIGSEGTLALVTEVVLRLSPLPRNLHVGLANFSTFQEGVRVVVSLQKLGHRLEALELADGPTMQSVNVSGLAPQRTFREVPTLFFKVAGPSMHIVQEQISTMKELCQIQGASSVETTQQEDEMNIIWGARKCMGTALLAMKKNPKDIFLHSDCAVPISNLASLVAGTQDLIAQASAAHQASWFCANVGHIGDGNVHSSIVCPQEHYEVAMSVIMEITRLALSLEGTVTGEHGIGLKLREALAEEVGDDGVTMMRSIKSALDPKGVLNPDKVFKIEKEGSAPKL